MRGNRRLSLADERNVASPAGDHFTGEAGQGDDDFRRIGEEGFGWRNPVAEIPGRVEPAALHAPPPRATGVD